MVNYGVDFHEAKDKHSESVVVGVYCKGIHIYQNGKKEQILEWQNIHKLLFKWNHFIIRTVTVKIFKCVYLNSTNKFFFINYFVPYDFINFGLYSIFKAL